MKMIYPHTYNQCKTLWERVRNKEKGKPLGNTWFRMKEDAEGNFGIFYGGWYDRESSNIDDEYKIYSIAPDDTITYTISPEYTTGRNHGYIASMLRQAEKGGYNLQWAFDKTYKHAGFVEYTTKVPIFNGLSINRGKVLQDLVPELETKYSYIKKEAMAKAQRLAKQCKLYALFKVFEEDMNRFQNTDWKNKKLLIEQSHFELIDETNIESISRFIATRRGFGTADTTSVGLEWKRYNQPFKYDMNKLAPAVLKFGALRYLAQTRHNLYAEWYNKAS